MLHPGLRGSVPCNALCQKRLDKPSIKKALQGPHRSQRRGFHGLLREVKGLFEEMLTGHGGMGDLTGKRPASCCQAGTESLLEGPLSGSDRRPSLNYAYKACSGQREYESFWPLLKASIADCCLGKGEQFVGQLAI